MTATPVRADTTTETPERAARRPVIVFADDDAVMLAALRGALRRERHTYDLLFVGSATEVLEIIGSGGVDVVITDMRMPDMDGAELLRIIRDDHPEIVRFALSGEASTSSMMSAMPLVHRWLAKPCDRDHLIDAVASALRYRRLLTDPAIHAAIAGVENLPSPPHLYSRLMAMAAADDVSADGVAELAGEDPAIAAKLLRLANSIFGGGGEHVGDLRQAVVRIGLVNFAQLVLSHEVLSGISAAGSIPGFDAEALANHAAAVGALAAELCTDSGDAANARLAGLLHLSGLLVEVTVMPDRLERAYRQALAAEISLVDAERAVDGLAHPDLAGHLLSIWGLPEPIVAAVAGAHEQPTRTDGALSIADAVRVARLRALESPTAASIGEPHRARVCTSSDLLQAVDG